MSMDFEELLDFVGGAGKYQVITYTLVGLAVMPTGLHNLANVFLTGLADYQCVTNDYRNSHTNSSHHAAHLNGVTTSMPSDTMTTTMQESRMITGMPEGLGQCVVREQSHDSSYNMTMPTVDCTRWWYDQEMFGKTLAMQYNLVCGDGYKRALAQSIYMLGCLIGAIAFGSLADSIGRKKTWGISMILLIISGVTAGVVPSYWAHVIFRFVSATAATGLFTSGFVLATESIATKYRLAPAVMYQIWFCVGYSSILVLIAYLARNYVITQILISAVVLLSLVAYRFVDESPRWLLVHRKVDDAIHVLLNISETNKTGKTSTDIRKAVLQIEKQESSSVESYSVLDLLRHKNLRNKTLNLCFQWCVISMVYYGLSMGSSDLAGSAYLNLFISGCMEVPGLVLAFCIAEKFGRRIAMVVFMIGCGVACLCLMFVPQAAWWLTSVLSNLGKMGISGAFGIIYVYSAELSPTVVRTVGVGAGSMCARVGSLLAPFVGDMSTYTWKFLPILIFGSCSLLAGILSLLLPETLGRKLPDTIADGEEFGKDQQLFGCRNSNKVDPHVSKSPPDSDL